jgi:hypothetical protein
LIKDVDNLALETHDSFDKTVRKLNLRKDYKEGKKGKPLTPELDEKIWSYEIKYNIDQITVSQTKCLDIIEQLKVLQIDCAKTQDNIENELSAMKVELKREIDRAKLKIDSVEKEIAAANCKWW